MLLLLRLPPESTVRCLFLRRYRPRDQTQRSVAGASNRHKPYGHAVPCCSADPYHVSLPSSASGSSHAMPCLGPELKPSSSLPMGMSSLVGKDRTGCRRSPVRILAYRFMRLHAGGALVVWPGMLLPNRRGYSSCGEPPPFAKQCIRGPSHAMPWNQATPSL